MSCTKYYPHYDNGWKIELHVHTTASDGAYNPGKIVELAWEKGVRILAITDHDTTSGWEEAAGKTLQYPVMLIPGIELSTVHEDHEIHILGYYIDPDSDKLQNVLNLLTDARQNRACKIVEKLNKHGIDIAFEDVRKKGSPGGSLGRPHVALALIEQGLVNTVEEAFEKFLNPDRPGYVPRYKLAPYEAIALIKKAKGIPVLAHPGIDCPVELLPSFIEAGLLGIEVFHPQHTQEMEKEFLRLACERNLIVTGGSDFHGHEQDEWRYFGEMPVPAQSIEFFKSWLLRKNLTRKPLP